MTIETETETDTDQFIKWYKKEGHLYPASMDRESVTRAMKIAYHQGAADALERSIERIPEELNQ